MQKIRILRTYLLLFSMYGSHIRSETILVNIDRIIKEIDENSPCNVTDWANNLSDACKCCLIKQVPQMGSGPGKKTAENIVQVCFMIQKQIKYCLLIMNQ